MHKTTWRRRRFVAAVVAFLVVAAACSDQGDIAQLPDELPADLATTTTTEPPDIDGPDVLLIVVDDMGVDTAPCYAESAVSAPTLESLCREGIVFDQAWSMPVGGATRASILTGRYGFRTDIGDQVRDLEVIDETELTLPRAVDAAELPHLTANFGRWDLGGDPETPQLMGWDYFGGLFLGNLPSYEGHTKYVNGVPRTITSYATTDQIDDTADWIGRRRFLPWVVWLATYAPSEPFHVPPADLHQFADLSGTEEDVAIELDETDASARPYYDAAIQALDTELGRLLEAIEPQVLDETTIIVVGDNGSPPSLWPPEVDEDGNELPSRRRGTLYEGGIHVPLIVAGAGVVDGGRRSDALVHTVDLFATILDLVGTSAADAVPADVELDSVTLTPIIENETESVRDRLYAEVFTDAEIQRPDARAIRDDQYKVIRFEDAELDRETETVIDVIEAYDLLADPTEESDLWETATGEARTRIDALLAELESFPSS